jgi:hypothetical protein
MDVAQRLQELREFDGDLHCNIRPIKLNVSWECPGLEAPRPMVPGCLTKPALVRARGGS